MFDIGFIELTMVAIIALLVLGPDRLPGAARTAGRWIGRARDVANHFRNELEREINADEMRKKLKEQLGEDELRKLTQELNQDFQDSSKALNASIMPPSAQKQSKTVENPASLPEHSGNDTKHND